MLVTISVELRKSKPQHYTWHSQQDSAHRPLTVETVGEISASGGPSRTDRKASHASCPVIIPNMYLGDGSWEEWINHFESLALVNGWDNLTNCSGLEQD